MLNLSSLSYPKNLKQDSESCDIKWEIFYFPKFIVFNNNFKYNKIYLNNN